MVGHKPREQFRYVKVKTIGELNNYIEHFEPILEEEEMIEVATYLMQLKQRSPGRESTKKPALNYARERRLEAAKRRL